MNVLDMSDPRAPVLTERLLTPAMLSPHESLVVSQQRGLLAAVFGNPATNVGIVDVYDISGDCRHPELKSSSPVGVLGHESGMAPDGRTFYSASPGTQTLVAVDISNPSAPVPLWIGPYDSHGLSISDDGNRAYVAGVNSGLIILDTSEIQARVPDPTVREVARLTWESMSIPQNAIPITVDGHEYLVEIDEFGAQDVVGAGRIIDIADEERPRVISNLRLDVHQPEGFDAQAGDPGAQNPLQGYAGHYCNVPRRDDPGIVACSMILSGLRVFDIRDPHNPREIAYYNAPVGPRLTPGFEAEQLGDVEPLLRARAGGDLVLRRLPGLLRRPADQRRMALRALPQPGDDDQRRLQGDRRNRWQGRDRRSPAARQDQGQGAARPRLRERRGRQGQGRRRQGSRPGPGRP